MRARWIVALAATAALVVSCSNDTELPANYHDSLLAQPTDVEATYEGTDFAVTWQIASTANVDAFVVSLTDTAGTADTRFVDDETATAYTESGLSLTSGSWYLIHLWAVDAAGFFGPVSDPDTLVVP